MTTQQQTAQHTRTPYHVNAIKDGRIIGDETAPQPDKLTINSANAAIATVYRPRDARFIVRACNAHDDLLAVLEEVDAVDRAGNYGTDTEGRPLMPTAIHDRICAAIAKARGT